jgi:hypothetical protein
MMALSASQADQRSEADPQQDLMGRLLEDQRNLGGGHPWHRRETGALNGFIVIVANRRVP